MKAIPVGRTSTGTLYYVIDGETDAVLVDKKRKTHNVNFLSYIVKKNVRRLETTDFHKFLWSGVNSPNDRWRNIVEYRVQPFPDHMLVGVESISKFPSPDKKSRYESVEDKENRAIEFKSLHSSGNHEKALGSALRRAARGGFRQATGGVRGFVRGAVFNPDADDADGDGWVQEGTQFARRAASAAGKPARRAKRVQRAQERLVSRQRVGMRAMRDYLPKSSRERWVQKSKQHYRDLYEKDTKRIQDMFHGGKEIKTYKDLKSAMEKAHPAFVSGESTADYLQGSNLDETISPAHYEHAMGFMLALSWNKELNKVQFNIMSHDTMISRGEKGIPDADGATGYRGRQRMSVTANGIDFSNSRKPQLKIDLMYKDRVSYDDVDILEQFGNFQLETHKMFFSMLHDVEPENVVLPGIGMLPNPRFDDEAKAAWEEARRMAARNVTIHEMGHAAHHVVSMNDALASVGLGPDEGLTVLDVQKRITDHINNSMSDQEVRRALLRSLANRTYKGSLPGTAIIMALMEQRDPQNASFLRWHGMPSVDGRGTIKVNDALASLFNSVGKDIFPNPTGSRWRAGDDLTWDAVESLFTMSASQSGYPIFSDQDMPYQRFLPWKGRMLAPLIETNAGAKLPDVDIALLIEHGIPRTPNTPAISAKDAAPIAEMLMRMGDVSTQIRNGSMSPNFIRPLRIPGTGGEVNAIDLFDPQLTGIDARTVLLDEAIQQLRDLLDAGLKAPQNIGMLRSIVETFFSTTKRFDDLTPAERELVRTIAELGTQGQWASYMAAFISHEWDDLFDFHDMELFAEIVAANGVGNEIFLLDGSGTRPLNANEKAVLAKVHKWLFPDADVRIS